MCSGEGAVVVSSMSKELKRGVALRYKKRLFGKDWREGCLVLHEDSTLVWYASPDDSRPAVGVRLKDCPEMIAAGQYCAQVPGRPDFPPDSSIKEAIAVGSRTKKHVHWFICESEQDMMEWMTGISNTLPPPPGAPGGPPAPSAPPADQVPAAQPYHPSGVNTRPPPPPYPQQQQRGPPPPHAGGGGRPPYPPQQYHGGGGGPQGGGGGNNTVIIRDRDSGYGGGMGTFATGMMVGAMAGGGWGFGWGYGGGWGYRGGWGGYHDHDVHIHNENNVYNNTTNNEGDVTNNGAQQGGQEAAAAGGGDGVAGADEGAHAAAEQPGQVPAEPATEDFGGGYEDHAPAQEDFGGYEQGYEDFGGGGGFEEDFGGGGGGFMEDFGGGGDMDFGGGFDF